MANSSAPIVKSALVDAFKALPGLDGVQVVYGDPIKGFQKECVFLGKILWSDAQSATGRSFGEDWATLGNNERTEQYNIELIVNIQKSGTDDETVEARAFELLGYIEVYLRGNPNLSYSKLTQYQIVPLHSAVVPAVDEGRECQINAVIRVYCRK